jgi:hypothetical protein
MSQERQLAEINGRLKEIQNGIQSMVAAFRSPDEVAANQFFALSVGLFGVVIGGLWVLSLFTPPA